MYHIYVPYKRRRSLRRRRGCEHAERNVVAKFILATLFMSTIILKLSFGYPRSNLVIACRICFGKYSPYWT